MNTPTPVEAAAPTRPEAVGPVEISAARCLYWSLRRELWENRSIYLAPLAVAAVALVGFFIGLVQLPDRVRAAATLGPMQQHQAIERPFLIVALILMLIQMLVACSTASTRCTASAAIAAFCSGSRCQSRISRRCSPRRAFPSWCFRW
jgi:ABC-2 type transport system permease protein